MAEERLRILFVEDTPADADLAQHTLRREGLVFDSLLVDTQDAFVAALNEFQPDLVLSDYALPTFDGMRALKLSRAHDATLPFILLTGALNEETAVACMKAGATDYVLKDRITRLPFVIQEAQAQRQLRLEKKATTQALRQAEELYRTILQASPDGIIKTDLQGHITFVSQRIIELCGLQTLSDASGRLMLDLIAPEDKAQAARDMQSVLLEKSYGSREYVMMRQDGARFIGEIKSTVLHDANGNPMSLVSVLRDITERRQTEDALRASEARYRSLFEDASVPMWEQDLSALKHYLDHLRADGVQDVQAYLDAHPAAVAYCAGLFKVIDVNRECLALFQTDNKDEIRFHLADYFVDQSWDMFKQMVAALAEGKTQFEGEIAIRRLHGDTRHIILRLSVGAPYANSLARVLVSLTDVTERKQREREMQAVSTISGAMRSVSTRTEMLTIIAQQIMRLLDAESVAIGSYDPITNEAVNEVSTGIFEPLMGTRVPAGQGVTGYVQTHQRAYITNDLQNEPLFYSREYIGKMRGLICVPMLTQQAGLIGWLSAGVQRSWFADDIRILTAITDMAANAIHRTTLHEQLEQRVHRLGALHAIDMAITSNFDLGRTLETVLAQVIRELGVDAADVLLLNPTNGRLEYLASHGFRSSSIQFAALGVCDKHAGRIAQSHMPVAIANLCDDIQTCQRRALIVAEDFVSYCGAPLIVKNQVKGVLEIFHRSPLNPDRDWLDFFNTLATQAAIAVDNMTLFENLQHSNAELVAAYDSTLEGWSRALDLRDKETEGHASRVTKLSVALARAMGLNEDEIVAIRRGALLHDIGKLGVPDGILHKPGPLTDDEWETMRKHPRYAYDMLAPIDYLKPSLDIPYCHHERWDGAGYPRGLKEEQIPIAARIFSVADVWDALRSDRPYRPAWSKAQALTHMQAQAGKQFDPHIVKVFLTVMQDVID